MSENYTLLKFLNESMEELSILRKFWGGNFREESSWKCFSLLRHQLKENEHENEINLKFKEQLNPGEEKKLSERIITQKWPFQEAPKWQITGKRHRVLFRHALKKGFLVLWAVFKFYLWARPSAKRPTTVHFNEQSSSNVYIAL